MVFVRFTVYIRYLPGLLLCFVWTLHEAIAVPIGRPADADLARIRNFTVVVAPGEASGLEAALNSRPPEIRATQASVRNSAVPMNFGQVDLDSAYGVAIARYLYQVASNQEARFQSRSELGWIESAASIGGERNDQWLKSSGLDSIFVVQQHKLELDYPTRVPDLEQYNFAWWALILDVWWLDTLSPWRLKNQFSLELYSLPSGRKVWSGSLPETGVWLTSISIESMDAETLQEGIQASVEGALREEWR